jgi:uncharacterized protein (TIGR02246 family)
MRVFPLFAIALLTAFSSVAITGPKDDALEVVAKWNKAFEEKDVDGITKLYAPDALFLGTGSKTVVAKPEGIRSYFAAAFQVENPPRVSCCGDDYSVMSLSDTEVVITGLDILTGIRDGKPFSARGRVTFIVAKRGSDWQIVHFHRSAMPN